MISRVANQREGWLEAIKGAFVENDSNNSKLQIAYVIDEQRSTLDLSLLSELTDPQGSGFYCLQSKKCIHFFDVSSSDLNHVMGMCAFLYYGQAPISSPCYDYDPCLMMGLAINDNGGVYPKLHDCSYFITAY